MKHLVMYSGGIGSFMAAKRVVNKHGPSDVVLIFADTRIEDEDLYRFLEEGVKYLGATLIHLVEGRTPWEVFHDERFLGNSRIDPCSKILKRQFIRKYLDRNHNPHSCIIYLGIDWQEIHRFDKAKKYWEPYRVEAPMCESPLVTKDEMLSELISLGIKPPRLYEMGFPHNNCGGFCVKAGQANFKNLLKHFPDRYLYHEEMEKHLQHYLKKDVTIMRKMEKGVTRNLSMKELRQLEQYDKDDWGGCNCFGEWNDDE
jgi:hypothetical protein